MSVNAAPSRLFAASRRREKGYAHLTETAFSIFLLGLPIWWALGIGFVMPMLLALILLIMRPSVNLHFTLGDCLLAFVIVALTGSAFVNGFVIAQEPLRFAAAIYNAAIWASALIIVQQFRALLKDAGDGRRRILHRAFWSFVVLIPLTWGAFVFAYAVRRFDLQFPSLFGAIAGNRIPDSAALIRQSTTITLTIADWGLHGTPMPRIGIYGPYPNATAIIIAILGVLALLHLHNRGGRRAQLAPLLEGLITATLAISLSRSVLAGWLAGLAVAGIAFGSPFRRFASIAAVAAALLLPLLADLSSLTTYREYSTNSRTDNYVRAVVETLDNNPVFGLGIKPREEISHIALGSHSTFISAFTKGGVLGLSLVAAYLLVLPIIRWLGLAAAATRLPVVARTQLRLLLTLQITLWAWLVFEDIDAPAIASILIFLFIAYSEFLAASLQPARRVALQSPMLQSPRS
ncbi:O-antigen ligase family protein [Mesorhizobium sp. M2E.F.Ca.ET.209.01.1.1]|jgi:hypothetical protein|uniref:O-antigen ligase family protein n=2 Tax=unclassified Mesorhizobium TaxID=325217 RepID=UPI00167A6E7D|nr:O-antigen ligase family protein [Mesorhizobium sp. M2E.F.Ca.ET.209.01.1.1]